MAAYFCACVVATTFLLIHYHALRQRALASPAERAREMPGLVPAQLGLAVLCGLAVIGLGCVLIVPLEAVSKNLSLAGAIRQLARLGAPTSAGANVFRFSRRRHAHGRHRRGLVGQPAGAAARRAGRRAAAPLARADV